MATLMEPTHTAEEKTRQACCRRRCFWGVLLPVLALVVYLVSLAPGAFPGLWASTIVQHAGIDPFPSMQHPLWTAWVHLVAAIPIGTLALRLNVLNALLGALVIGLFYDAVLRLPGCGIHRGDSSQSAVRKACEVAAITATLALAFCPPFWLIATRAHPLMLGLLLLLVVVRLFSMLKARPQSKLRLCLLAFVYGLAVTEFSTMIILAPLFGLAVLYVLWQSGGLRGVLIAPAALCFLLGTVPYYLQAWGYSQAPVAEWREFSSYWQVLWQIWRGQCLLIIRSVTQVGWLLLFFTAVLPWIVTVGSCLVAPSQRMHRVGTKILYTALTALAVVLLLNIRLSPWILFGTQPLLVMPYVLIASWGGFLMGYWYVSLATVYAMEGSMKARLNRVGRRLVLPMSLAVLVVAAVRNAEAVNGRPGAPLVRFADQVVESLNGRTWVISRGRITDCVRLAARERGLKLKILDLNAGRNPAYLRYAASLFDDPGLQSKAALGLGPLLNAWFAEGEDIAEQVAILDEPDLWLANGFFALPNKILYLGVRSQDTVDLPAVLSAHQDFWSSYAEAFKAARPTSPSDVAWKTGLMRHLSRLANNLGVLLGDWGDRDQSLAAYDSSLELDEGNLSAMLNLMAASSDSNPERAAALEEEIGRHVEGDLGRINAWALARQFGYVRNPEMFAKSGWAWAVTGQPSPHRMLLASARSTATGTRANDAGVPSQELKKREAALEANPDDPVALLSMARVSILKGDFDAARQYLDRMSELGVPEGTVDQERAALEAQAGNLPAARDLLLKVVNRDPSQVKAWVALARLATMQGDKDLLRRCVDAVGSSKVEMTPGLRLSLAEIVFAQGDAQSASQLLNEVLRQQPNNLRAYEMLVQTDVQLGRRDLAERHLAQLLNLDPKNAKGNHLLGTLQIARKNFLLAEASFRTSIETEPTSSALNDLAWVLLEQGKLDEAIRYAAEAVEINDKNYAAWDTLGVARLRSGLVDEAQTAILRAMEFAPQDPEIMLHMAQVYEQKGMDEEALTLADSLLNRANEMRPEAYAEVRALIMKLRAVE